VEREPHLVGTSPPTNRTQAAAGGLTCDIIRVGRALAAPDAERSAANRLGCALKDLTCQY
jgi:hypothetical protein